MNAQNPFTPHILWLMKYIGAYYDMHPVTDHMLRDIYVAYADMYPLTRHVRISDYYLIGGPQCWMP